MILSIFELDAKLVSNIKEYQSSECFARKMWENFTPKEMYDMSPKNEKKREEMQENCKLFNF